MLGIYDMNNYHRQYERAKRYLERIRSIYAGTYSLTDGADNCDDEIISFFIHCYHIRDWILHLSKIPITPTEIDRFINENEALKICADLCNGEKHCRLERTTRTGGQPHLAFREWQVTHFTFESGFPSTQKARYKILSGDQWIDALAVAEESMKLWEKFMLNLQKQFACAIGDNNETV